MRPEPVDRPPSVDRLARDLASHLGEPGLPHPILVDLARTAIAGGDWSTATADAERFRRSLLTPVVNATGVLLHTNLGRAPLAYSQPAHATTIEFDLESGERGSRHRPVGQLLARLAGSEQALVVNNNAAAVLLVTAALASGRDVAVSRGESVEIGGAFRVPDVVAQSGARLLDVGTTNRTRLADYANALNNPLSDLAMILKVHPSNYRVEGFVESTSVAELATLEVPLVVDVGSGLLDATTPWCTGPPPAWLADEPAVVQTLVDGADIVTFSADKLLGGPQAGVIVGRADLVARCAAHPLARALRCGSLVLGAVNDVALSYLNRTVTTDIPFWRMAMVPVEDLRRRADAIVSAAGVGAVVDSAALPGAGSAPGATIASIAVSLRGDRLADLRRNEPPVIARAVDGHTLLDLRSFDPDDDPIVSAALARLSN